MHRKKDTSDTGGFSRRDFLKTGMAAGLGAASILDLVTGGVKSAAYAGGNTGPGKTGCHLRHHPAHRLRPDRGGAREGLFQEIRSQLSRCPRKRRGPISATRWPIGALDGAHMLAGMPIAATLGIGAPPKATITAFSMDLNGNGITVSNDCTNACSQPTRPPCRSGRSRRAR